MAVHRKLTTRQFNAATKHFPRMAEHTRTAAYQLLVEQKRAVDIEDEMGIKRQAIQRAAREIYDMYILEKTGCPEGWVIDQVMLPPERMKEVKAIEQAELKKHGYAQRKE